MVPRLAERLLESSDEEDCMVIAELVNISSIIILLIYNQYA